MASILVVDDDRFLREMLSVMLEKRGYDVVVACNGKEAEEVCRKVTVDLAMIDIIMPVQEGMETMMVLKYNYPDMKIIAMTGGGKTSPNIYLDVAKQMGVETTLQKPFRHVEVLSAVKSVMN